MNRRLLTERIKKMFGKELADEYIERLTHHFIYKNDKLNLNKVLGCILGFIGVIVANFNTDMLNFSFSFYLYSLPASCLILNYTKLSIIIINVKTIYKYILYIFSLHFLAW